MEVINFTLWGPFTLEKREFGTLRRGGQICPRACLDMLLKSKNPSSNLINALST
jgi:hypothetical protein